MRVCAQLQDITQWGGPDEVARLVLPPGTRAQQLESRILKSEPKDTGTVRGLVEVAPTTIYRCAATRRLCYSMSLQLCVPWRAHGSVGVSSGV